MPLRARIGSTNVRVPDPTPPEAAGKTLDEQIEGDHAYQDEPPEHDPVDYSGLPDDLTDDEAVQTIVRALAQDVEHDNGQALLKDAHDLLERIEGLRRIERAKAASDRVSDQ